MTYHKPTVRRIFGCLLVVAGIGLFTQLARKEGQLIFFGQQSSGVIENITEEYHSSSTTRRKGESKESYNNRRRHSGSISHRLHICFTPQGSTTKVRFNTIATFGFDSKVGDKVEVIYLPGSVATAKIYSAKQLWLPAIVGFIFGSLCLGGGLLLMLIRSKST